LIDPIEETLVQKENEKSKKAKVYREAIKAIEKYISEKELAMLRYQLNSIYNDKNKN